MPSLRFPTSVLLRAGGRASRAVDDFRRPCGRLSSSARAERTESRSPADWKKEESPYSTPSRASLGHRLHAWEFGERSRAANQPKTRPTFRSPRRARTCERIEMLSVVHHSFARVRIAPRHARVEPGSASFPVREKRWSDRVLGAFGAARPVQAPACAGCHPALRGSLAAHAGGRRSTPTFRWVASSSGSAVGSAGF